MLLLVVSLVISEPIKFDLENVEVQEEEEVNPWSVSEAHGLIHDIVSNSRAGDIQHVIQITRKMCSEKAPHLCLGPKKSDILLETMKTVMNHFPAQPLHIMEMGAHSGDGTVHLIDNLPRGSVVFAVEKDHHELAEGHKLIRHATHGRGIKYHPISWDYNNPFEQFIEMIKREHNIHHFHSVMFDHKQEHFHKHLKHLEDSGMLLEHSHLITDNVKRLKHKMKPHLENIKNGPYETKFHTIETPYYDEVSVSRYTGKKDEL